MHAVALRCTFRIPEARSLKAKRRLLKPIIAELQKRWSVSVAEIDDHDLWQQATIGVAAVASDSGHLEQIVSAMRRMLETHMEIEIVEFALSYLEEPE